MHRNKTESVTVSVTGNCVSFAKTDQQLIETDQFYTSLSERARLVEREAKAVQRQRAGEPRSWKPVPSTQGTTRIEGYTRTCGNMRITVKSHRRYNPSD